MTLKLIIAVVFLIVFEEVEAQKGNFSLSAGAFASFPFNLINFYSRDKIGGGLEALGQYNFSNKNVALLQTSIARHGIKLVNTNSILDTGVAYKRTIYSLRGGYRYIFVDLGFFANVLVGFDKNSGYGSGHKNSSIALGVGKRFKFVNSHFMEVGIDYISNSIDSRLNIKAIFSVLQLPK